MLCCRVAPQDFQRLLQDVNRTTMQAIQVYVDEVGSLARLAVVTRVVQALVSALGTFAGQAVPWCMTLDPSLGGGSSAWQQLLKGLAAHAGAAVAWRANPLDDARCGWSRSLILAYAGGMLSRICRAVSRCV